MREPRESLDLRCLLCCHPLFIQRRHGSPNANTSVLFVHDSDQCKTVVTRSFALLIAIHDVGEQKEDTMPLLSQRQDELALRIVAGT